MPGNRAYGRTSRCGVKYAFSTIAATDKNHRGPLTVFQSVVLQGLSRTVQTAMVSPFANCIVTAVREVCVPSVMVLLGPLNWASPSLSVTA